jgi:hypothetical protein
VNERWNVAHNDVADLDHLELHQGGTRKAVGGCDLDAVVACGGVNAKPRCIAFAQRDLGGAGIDHELHPAAIDSRLHPEMAIVAARNGDRARVRGEELTGAAAMADADGTGLVRSAQRATSTNHQCYGERQKLAHAAISPRMGLNSTAASRHC